MYLRIDKRAVGFSWQSPYQWEVQVCTMDLTENTLVAPSSCNPVEGSAGGNNEMETKPWVAPWIDDG